MTGSSTAFLLEKVLLKIEGTIDHIIYRNDANGYSVFELVLKNGEMAAVTGTFPQLDAGESISAEGEYREHSVYGMQFHAASFEIVAPEDAVSIMRYLSSGAVKGIGEGLAKRIVKAFGSDSFRIMEEEPERLAEIKGISIRKAMEISAAFESKAASRQAFSFLQQYGISNVLAQKIYEKYKDRLYDIIRTNPYQLIEDIEGIGFKTADRIAYEAGIRQDSSFRIRSGILYTLLEAENDGNMCLPEEELCSASEELLGVSGDDTKEQIDYLSVERRLIRKKMQDTVMVYHEAAYNAETECARLLIDLDLRDRDDTDLIYPEVKEIERKTQTQLEDMQREAVVHAISDGVLIMTGGPGTGKTTTINLILKYFASKGMEFMLTAPTGRAAKRMTEATGYEARTIHRLLGVNAGIDGKNAGFDKNQQNPLETDAVIVDEMSMVDVFLFRSLLRAITPGTKLILVGDDDQLPSVGPGAVLKDIVASHAFNVVTLTKIYRQSEAGDIVMNAHSIRMGRNIRLDNSSKDFFFLERQDAQKIIAGIIYLIEKKLPPYVNCRPDEIQVMTPMRKGPLGVENLNKKLQEALNPKTGPKQEIDTVNGVLRLGDKVMQIRNDYQIEWEISTDRGVVVDTGTGVFNGDLGVVISVNTAAVMVRFEDGRRAEYKNEMLNELELAYAITIHKSQGSEYPAVVIPLLNGPQMLMNRNLLYTGITRAKSCVVILGKSDTVSAMIANTTEQKRYTGLKERIIEIRKMESDTEKDG